MLAYHGNLKLKRKYMARVRAHQKADEIVQSYGYWKGRKELTRRQVLLINQLKTAGGGK